MGTRRGPIALLRAIATITRTSAMVVDMVRVPESLSNASNNDRSGIVSASTLTSGWAGNRPAPCGGRADTASRENVGRLVEARLLEGRSSTGMSKRVADLLQLLDTELFLLVTDVLAFAGLAHAVALHGVRENHRGSSERSRSRPCKRRTTFVDRGHRVSSRNRSRRRSGRRRWP